MPFYLVVKSAFQGYQAACQEIWRMYQASCEEIFCILAVWKSDCCRFVKLTFQGTSQWVGIFLMFEAWKCDFAQSWNHRFKGTKFRGINFFSCEQIIRILSAWKCDFYQLEKPMFQGISQRGGYFKHFLYYLDFSEMRNPRFKLGMASLGYALLGLTWLGLVWLGMAWHGLAWLGLAWLGIA